MIKKAFSLVELIIAMGILGVIMMAVMTLFIIGVKNYSRESQRNFMQKEINFTADDIGVQIKQAAEVPGSYDTYTRGSNTLILAVPAIDEDEEFLYIGDALLYDYFIYYLSGGTLLKKIITNENSIREDKENPVLKNVNQFECSYTPETETELVSCNLSTSQTISGTTLNFSANKTSRLRNQR